MKKHIIALCSTLLAGLMLALIIPSHSFAAPKTMADGTVFDAEYYAKNNPDVVAVFGTTESMLYYHYSVCGKLEGRLPAAPGSVQTTASDFDAAYYAARYPDVKKVFGNNAALLKAHYEQFGKAEGRFGSAAQEQAAIAQLTNAQATVAVTTQPAAQSDYAYQVFQLVNQERAKAGVAPLAWDNNLNNAVAIRSQEIAVSFSHTRPNGSPFYTTLISGPNYYFGENIAAGQRTPESVMNSWMNSSGHRANILNTTYTGMAVGYYKTGTGYGSYWVQIFSRP